MTADPAAAPAVAVASSSRSSVLFVGAFRPPARGELMGGQLYACRTLLESPLADAFAWIKLDTTMESVPPPPLRRRLWLAMFRLGRFVTILCRERVDTVLIFTSSGLSFCEKGLMTIIAKLGHKRTVLCPRSGFILDDYRDSFFMRRFIPLVLRFADAVVCQGKQWRFFFQSVCRLPPERFTVIGNWIDVEHYQTVSPLVPRQPMTVLLMGWIERNKGVFDLVEAVDLFRGELEGTRFVICGRGSDWDELHETIEQRGLNAFFEFRGWVEEDQKLAILEQSDVLLMLSHREGMPNALLEAMASGRAIIATAVGAVPELVVDEVAGFLCRPGDVATIGRRLLEFKRDPALRMRMGDVARRRMREKHHLQNLWPKWKQLLTPS
jgi:glycosyltransferase involved in cell wall biosynthesis